MARRLTWPGLGLLGLCAALLYVVLTGEAAPAPVRAGPLAQATATNTLTPTVTLTPTSTATPTSTPTATPTRDPANLVVRLGVNQVPIRAYHNGDGTYSLSVVVVTPVP